MTETQSATTDEGAAGAQASSEAASETSVTESDFKARAASDPAWAWEQMRSFQSRGDSRVAKSEEQYSQLVQKMGSAKELIDQFGADTISAAVKNYGHIRNSPEIGETVQNFERTGELLVTPKSEPNAEAADEYKTPEEIELANLKMQVQTLRGETKANTMTSGRTVFEGHMEDVFREFNFTEKDVSEIRAGLHRQFDSWQQQGQPGLDAVKGVMGLGGAQTVRGLMLASVTPDQLRAASENTNLRKQEGLAGMSTGGPSGTASRGLEPPADFKTIHEAADWARANPEAHSSE